MKRSRMSASAMVLSAVALVLLVASAAPASADGQIRVDRFRLDGQREGYAVIDQQTGRVDFYDTRATRTGYGTIAPSGKVETFDLRGRRTGSGTLTPSGSIREERR